MSKITCISCNEEYPMDGLPFLCKCGGTFDFLDFPEYQTGIVEALKPGMWKYRNAFGLPDDSAAISLGEGGTPLLEMSDGIFLKMESLNPTGSYKDRGTSVLVSMLKTRGVTSAVEDSSGNAGASFAAYCARSKIQADVYIPESTSGPKRTQIEMYGANVIKVSGARSEAAKAVLDAAKKGAVYASHAYMPFGLTGIATISYEIVEQLGKCPGTIIAPVGHGGLLYGMMRGFEALKQAGIIQNQPYYLAVQSLHCAPLAVAFNRAETTIREITPGNTAAEGVKVTRPVRGVQILERLYTGNGKIVSIPEEELIQAYKDLALKGIYAEPTSALAWAAALQSGDAYPKPIVAVITGSGYKSSTNL